MNYDNIKEPIIHVKKDVGVFNSLNNEIIVPRFSLMNLTRERYRELR